MVQNMRALVNRACSLSLWDTRLGANVVQTRAVYSNIARRVFNGILEHVAQSQPAASSGYDPEGAGWDRKAVD